MSLIDLHIHSANSDGQLLIEDIEQLLIEKRIELVSFTDHNYLNNYKTNKLKIIKGVELDCEFDAIKTHILLYNYINDDILSSKINDMNAGCFVMIKKLLDNINHYYGININNDGLQIRNKRDVIRWLMNNGYGNNPDDVADKYTSCKSKCYVPNVKLQFKDICDFIGNNTIVSLAHPEVVSVDLDYLDGLINRMMKYGLNAIEVINKKHVLLDYNQLLYLARKNNLFCTFGSDFHRKDDEIGVECENKYVKVLLK